MLVQTYPWLSQPQRQLAELLLTDKLHHALLLTGPVGIGKHLLAEHLAKQLMCHQPKQIAACGECKSCLLVQAGHHPDLMQVKAELSIGVEQIRDVSGFMQSSAQQSGARVVLIPAADKMTEAAANALLKTLEEPGARSFLILQTAYKQRLLPTILSRCQQWLIPPQFGTAAEQWLQQHSGLAVPAFLLDFCGGAPLIALDLLQTGTAAELAQQLVQLEDYVKTGTELTQRVKRLASQPELTALLSWFIRQQCYQHSDTRQLQLLDRLAQWCRDEQQILGQNKSLALTTLLLDLYKLLHIE